MDPSRTQLPAWQWIVTELKKNVKDPSRELLTVMRICNKFTSLKKKFKILYFDTTKTDIHKQKLFPYYIKMCDLFTDYATKHLNNSSIQNMSRMEKSSQEIVNETVTEADVTNYVLHLLNDEDMDKTSLTILPYDDCENFSEHVSSVNYDSSENSDSSHFGSNKNSAINSQTESQKVRIKLAEIPSDAIYIHKEKMRIDPNTPFNRHINSSTILNHRSMLLHNSQAPSMKRKLLDDLEPLTKKKLNPVAHSSHRLSNGKFSESDYMIEALDECEVSDITMRQSRAIYHDSSLEESHISSHESHEKLQSAEIKHQDSENELSLLPDQESIQSILEVPPCPTFDDTSIDVPRMAKLSATIRCVPREIIPKKLMQFEYSNNITGSSQGSLMNVNDNQPPKWFQSFLKKYDEDVRIINAKLDKIISSKNTTSPVMIHPKVLKIKRDSI